MKDKRNFARVPHHAAPYMGHLHADGAPDWPPDGANAILTIMSGEATSTDATVATIQYRTPSRLADSLKLQFRCSFYMFRYLWIIWATIVVVLLSLKAMSLWPDPWAILMPVAGGLIGGTLASPVVLIVRRLFRRQPAEIKADIGDEGVKVGGHQGFSYVANWSNLTWLKEGSSAYVMKFNKLFVRLPKRGFIGQQETAFRNLVTIQAPASALKWKTYRGPPG